MRKRGPGQRGYSLIELLTAMSISVLILGVAVAALTQALQMRARGASTTDAITSTQAALNVMSREIGNSGFGLTSNGIVVGDSDDRRLHIRANVFNNDGTTTSPGEDVTFFFDTDSKSVVKYDPNANGTGNGLTYGVVNRVSDVTFGYYDYVGSVRTGPNPNPSADTGRIEITLTVFLPDVQGQPSGRTVTVKSDVTLRNSPYMRGQY